MTRRAGLGHNLRVATRPSFLALVPLALLSSLGGCLGFGGPLVNHDEAASESESAAATKGACAIAATDAWIVSGVADSRTV